MESVRCMVCPPVLERFNCISTDLDLSLLSQLLVSRIESLLVVFYGIACGCCFHQLIDNPAPNRSAKEHAYICSELSCLLLTFSEETRSQSADFFCYYDSSVCDNSILKSLDGKKHEEVVYLATKKSVINRGTI